MRLLVTPTNVPGMYRVSSGLMKITCGAWKETREILECVTFESMLSFNVGENIRANKVTAFSGIGRLSNLPVIGLREIEERCVVLVLPFETQLFLPRPFNTLGARLMALDFEDIHPANLTVKSDPTTVGTR